MSEEELIRKIRAMREAGEPARKIREELRLSTARFYYLLGRGGIEMRPLRGPDVTSVRVYRGKPILVAATGALRELGWKEGQRVRWRVERGRLVGEPA